MYPVNSDEIRLVQDMFRSLGLLGIESQVFLPSDLVEKIKGMSVNQAINDIDKIFDDEYIKNVSKDAEQLNIDSQGTKTANIIKDYIKIVRTLLAKKIADDKDSVKNFEEAIKRGDSNAINEFFKNPPLSRLNQKAVLRGLDLASKYGDVGIVKKLLGNKGDQVINSVSLLKVAVETNQRELIQLFLGEAEKTRDDYKKEIATLQSYLDYFFDNLKQDTLADHERRIRELEGQVEELQKQQHPQRYRERTDNEKQLAIVIGIALLILAIIILIPLLIICAIKSYKERLEQEATDVIDKAKAITKSNAKRDIPHKDQGDGKIENIAIVSASNVERRYMEVIRSILGDREVFKIDLNKVDEYGMTAFMYAASSGHMEVIKILLAHKNPEVNPDIRSNDGMTALMLAAKNGHVETVKILLAHRNPEVNPNIRSNDGMTALMLAAKNGHVEAVKILLAHRNPEVNPNIRSNDGMTALTLAVKYGKTEVATEFLKANLLMGINKKDLFKMAVKNNHFDTAKLFLEDARKEFKENKNKLLRYRIGLGLILLSTIIAAVFFPPCLIIIPVAIGVHIYYSGVKKLLRLIMYSVYFCHTILFR